MNAAIARRVRHGVKEDGARWGGRGGGAMGQRVAFGNFRVCVISSVTCVNRDRAAAGLQVYRTDNAARSIGFSEMQRRG